jgi:DNA-directed RNA polymerase specialized sigma24 family protein
MARFHGQGRRETAELWRQDAQAAELTGAPLGRVKTRMFLTMRRLRWALRPDDGPSRGG